jgi:23S rRNA-/tRNA-specific pseudouridylate synthase
MSNVIKIIQWWQRIDQYLTKEFLYSRNFWERVIERGGVAVMQDAKWKMKYDSVGTENDNPPSHRERSEMECGDPFGDCFVARNDQGYDTARPIKKSYILKDGDTIIIDSVERYLDGGILAESPIIDLDIRLEKEDYLVLYKPKGVLSHPNSIRDVGAPNIVGGLYHHFKALPSMAHFIRAGLIHRLDKETDGLMIIAKTEKGLAHFKALFQQKSWASTIPEKEAVPLKKYYRALCDVTEQWARFLQRISVFPYYLESFIHPKVPFPGEPKWGITKILECKMHDAKWKINASVELLLEILTGRTHQIRYQLSEVGLPIIWDYLYHSHVLTSDNQQPTTSMQLSAWKLEFLDCEWEMITLSVF